MDAGNWYALELVSNNHGINRAKFIPVSRESRRSESHL
jgi:hypothetical protein